MKIHSVIAATLAFFFLLSGQARAQESLPQLVKKIQPAVVTVIAYDAKGKPKVQGSGFFIDQFGEFLTNSHVLEGASRAEVKTFQGRRFPVLGIEAQDQAGDLVIAAADLKKEKTHFLNISPSRPEVGERVAVVGSPLGLEQTLSEGVVSAVRQVPDIGEILQITAPISRGSSGSPVVNMKGEVIGVATFIFKEGQNLNFAVPGSRALALRPKGRYVLIEPLEKTPETSTKPPYGEEVNKFIKARNYEKAT